MGGSVGSACGCVCACIDCHKGGQKRRRVGDAERKDGREKRKKKEGRTPSQRKQEKATRKPNRRDDSTRLVRLFLAVFTCFLLGSIRPSSRRVPAPGRAPLFPVFLLYTPILPTHIIHHHHQPISNLRSTPRRRPRVPRRRGPHGGVVPPPAQRVAPQDPPRRQDRPLAGAERLDGFDGVFGAGGEEAAGRGQQRGDELLVALCEVFFGVGDRWVSDGWMVRSVGPSVRRSIQS